MLILHTFLLAMLFRNDAFEAPSLRPIEDLRQLFLKGSRQQMLLPLKWETADCYAFCRVNVRHGKVTVSQKQSMTKSTLTSQMKLFGEIAGFLWSMFTHQFRYGGGTIMKASVEQEPELIEAIQRRDRLASGISATEERRTAG